MSSGNSESEAGRYLSQGSKCLWGDCRSVSYHYLTMRRSFPVYISSSLMVVYASVGGVVTKGKFRHRKAIFQLLQCILMQSARFCVCAGMGNLDMFFISIFILKAIWVACLQSCGASWVGRRRIDTSGGCLSVLGFLWTGLMVLERISHVWCVS